MTAAPPPDVSPTDDVNWDDPWASWDIVVRAVRRVRPFIDLEDVDRAAPIADEAGLDERGIAQLLAAVTAECGVVVPPHDRPLVVTLDGLGRYVADRLAPRR